MNKQCSRCLETKPVDSFGRHRGGKYGVRGQCKSCRSAFERSHYQKNKASISARNARWRKKNPEASRAIWLRHKFGISVSDYDELLEEQEGGCGICGRRFGKSLCIDHDHVTGVIRGLLCSPCNRGLGLLGDSAESLRRAVGYLSK